MTSPIGTGSQSAHLDRGKLKGTILSGTNLGRQSQTQESKRD